MPTNVLLVDDEQMVLSALSRCLQSSYYLSTAYSAAEARRLLDGPTPIDVVVTDIGMPGVDGIDFVSQIGPQRPNTRFLVLTGSTDRATTERASQCEHVYKLMHKPVSITKLQEAIEEASRSLELQGRLAKALAVSMAKDAPGEARV